MAIQLVSQIKINDSLFEPEYLLFILDMSEWLLQIYKYFFLLDEWNLKWHVFNHDCLSLYEVRINKRGWIWKKTKILWERESIQHFKQFHTQIFFFLSTSWLASGVNKTEMSELFWIILQKILKMLSYCS